MKTLSEVPASLRAWFVSHFFVDMVVAVPLFIFPVQVLRMFGWMDVDVLAIRLVAAALFAVGGTSFLVRDATADVYRHMLDLKIIWSLVAMVGILISSWREGVSRHGPSAAHAAIFALFLLFFIVWFYYRFRLRRVPG
ncbi:MAG: hypothetical protein Q8R07_04580 [Candidatus Uhrbacteria bacterium]|nr:hypothetical protein [Candidatus Uhrbacteria bacterium]